jgi:DNA-binding MarR family transcriptional regulator
VPTTDLTEHERRAWWSLLAMTDQLMRCTDRDLRNEAGLSSADFAVLARVLESRRGGVRFFELAAGLGWEQSRLSHQLRRMEQRGLIARASCPADGRGAIVVCTPLGRSAMRVAGPAHLAAVKRALFDALTAPQVAALVEICDTVRAHNELDG